jgi:hypothetical protein
MNNICPENIRGITRKYQQTNKIAQQNQQNNAYSWHDQQNQAMLVGSSAKKLNVQVNRRKINICITREMSEFLQNVP